MTDIQSLFGLAKPPIAIGFLQDAPAGVERWIGGAVPAGCAFWKHAQEGNAFYTLPEDHYNCAVGTHTHAIQLPAARAGELQQTVGFMVEKGYIALEEVPGIPTLTHSPRFIAYAPVGLATFTPDVFVISANPAQAMLLYETAVQSGIGPAAMNALGRPGCAVLPLALNSGQASISLGCRGNRTFTGLPESELYLCIPGDRWEDFSARAAQVHQANSEMGAFYHQRRQEFAQQP